MQLQKISIFIVLLFTCATLTQAKMYANQDTINLDSLRVLSYVEGPHIVQFPDSHRVEVFYIEHDSLKNRTRKIVKYFRFKKGILTFKGFAGDDTFTYRIPKTMNPDSTYFSKPEKMIVLGDIHGEYDSLIKLLSYNKVVDQNLNWIWGNGHLIFTGDVFDRGSNVTECLWLILRLEMQALEAGGKVHFIWGNHEIMTFLYDNRYVHEKYLHAAHFFNIKYSTFFTKSSILGKWLRSKNTTMKIGDILFVHGGISPLFIEKKMSLEKINTEMRYYINNIVKIVDSAEIDTSMIDLLLFTHSPAWYRGYIHETPDYPRITIDEINNILNYYDAKTIILGHTPVAEIYPMYNHKLIAVDVPIAHPKYEDQGLLIENQKKFRIFTDREKEPL